jgi:hypothetical protein
VSFEKRALQLSRARVKKRGDFIVFLGNAIYVMAEISPSEVFSNWVESTFILRESQSGFTASCEILNTKARS